MILGLFLANILPFSWQNDAFEQPDILKNSTEKELSGMSSQTADNNTDVQAPVGISVSGSMEALSFHELDTRSEIIVIGRVKEILPSFSGKVLTKRWGGYKAL